MLDDYQRSLKDFDEVNVFEPNNVFILESCGIVKNKLKDYWRALEDLDEADVFDPKNAFILIIHAYTNWSFNNKLH
jgi:tetratricopeptide (TPR) repeat protein